MCKYVDGSVRSCVRERERVKWVLRREDKKISFVCIGIKVSRCHPRSEGHYTSEAFERELGCVCVCFPWA